MVKVKNNEIFNYTDMVKTVNAFKDIDEVKLVKIRDLEKKLKIKTIK